MGKGLSEKQLWVWMSWAICSLPVPFSPNISTLIRVGATRCTRFLMLRYASPLPYEYRHLALPFLFTFLDNGMEKRNEFVLHQLFGDIVQRTEFHALHCGMHLGVIGHDNERLPFVIDTHPFQ